MLRIDDKSALELREYLLAHREDIALGIDDYGDLKGVFYCVYGMEA